MSETDATATPGRDRFATTVESGHAVVSLTTMATITVVVAILYVAKDLFLPLVLGMLFAFILTPVVNYLRHLGLRDMPAVIVTVLAALGIHFFVTLPVLLLVMGKVNPLKHLGAMKTALLMAFSTSSSSATLPVTLRNVQDNAGERANHQLSEECDVRFR